MRIQSVCAAQSSRLEEQRSELPRPSVTMDVETADRRPIGGAAVSNIGATVPDEDFFSLIMRVQGGRMDDQRATVSEFIPSPLSLR